MGLAVGDDVTGIALPFGIVAYEGADRAAHRIADTAREVDAARVVLGLPTREDGSLSPACRRTEKLQSALAALGIEVVLQSEFLSTDEARRRARAAGRQRNQPVDDIAAQILLEEHLAGRAATTTTDG